MALRTSLAAMMGITVLFLGVFAIGESARQNEPEAGNTAAESASEMAEGIFGGLLGGGAGEGVIWFGVAAIILVALGFLTVAWQAGGGR